ncbi:MAG: histidine phosphatase family protein [Mycoplasmatota bacterium]
METIIYLIRHAESNMNNLGEYNVKEDSQSWNEKNILSVDGEIAALQLSENNELENIDVIYSSHYSRTMATAKYIANHNNLKLDIEEDLQERIFGFKNWSEFNNEFGEKQITNWDYKNKNGESLNEVNLRMTNIINKLIETNLGKRIVVVTHGMAILTYFKNFYEIKYDIETKKCNLYKKGEYIFDSKFSMPHLFKLTFDKNKNLVDLKIVEINK